VAHAPTGDPGTLSSQRPAPAGPSSDGEQGTQHGTTGPSGLLAARTAVGLVLGQLGAVTALAFYFGWVRTSAYLAYFGLDTSQVEFSTADYVLRSVGAAYWPLMWIGATVVLALTVHPHIRTALAGAGDRSALYLNAAVAVGLAMLGVAAAGLTDLWIFPSAVPVIPLLITAGLTLIAYSWALRSSPPTGGAAGALRAARAVALAGLIAGGLFWSWGSYAHTVGDRAAQRTMAELGNRTEVLIFSARSLGIAGPGVHVDAIGSDGSVYRFRYTGLRLLLRSGDTYFLLPKGWHRGDASVIVLPPSDEMRLEFFAPP